MNPQAPSGRSDAPPVVLVTGATTGIGLATLQTLRTRRFRVIATARGRSIDRFHELGIHEDDSLRIRPLDVTDAVQAAALFDEIEGMWDGVDMLVNNAGVSYRAVLEHMRTEDERRQFDVNYFGPMMLIRHAIPHMRQQRFGRIVNISSVGGMMAMPTMSIYSASKFALEGASEGLYYELRPWNIRVTLVQPGFVRSDGFEKVKLTIESRRSWECPSGAYHPHYEHMSTFIARLMRMAIATPDSIAKKIVNVLESKNPPLRTPGAIDASLFSLLRRVLPRSLYHRILYRSLPGVSTWGKENWSLNDPPPPQAS